MSQSNETPAVRPPDPFYLSALQKELACQRILKTDRILVACGGELDRITLVAAGFTNAVITNLAPHRGHQDYTPFTWEHQNIENLTYADDSFDIAIVHSGLHHCYNPLRALGELCRISRKAVIAYEPYETWLTRLGAKLGYGQKYEDQAVHIMGGSCGGVANTEIPNYVYRFNESEIRKFARTYYPHAEPRISFHRALRLNTGRFQFHHNPLLRITMSLAAPALHLLCKLFHSLNNNLCFVIYKPGPDSNHPWIQIENDMPHVDKNYLIRKYGPFPS